MKYRVTGSLTITVVVDVEAQTPAQARELAEQAGVRSLCNQCADMRDGEWSTTGELDGEPEILETRRLR